MIIKISTIIILLFLVQASDFHDTTSPLCDNNDNKNLTLFYILGMLTEGGGGRRITNGRIDYFYSYEAAKPDLLEKSLILLATQKNIQTNIRRIVTEYGLVEIYCDSLYDIINSFFDIKYIQSWDSKGKLLNVGLGRIRSDMIKSASREQQLAYLCGAYYRHGWNPLSWPNSWQYSLMTSKYKVELIRDLLIEIGCDVEITYERDITPGGVILKFIPTQEYKKWVTAFIEEGS